MRDAAVDPTSDSGVPPPPRKRVFVTQATFSVYALGNACQNSADAAGLGATFHPWLSHSDGAGTTVSALDGIRGEGPWFLLDGTMAFRNRAQLATVPSTAISLTEMGTRDPGTSLVWTGTRTGGQVGPTCYDWGSASDFNVGVAGFALSDNEWTDRVDTECDGENHVYCFEE